MKSNDWTALYALYRFSTKDDRKGIEELIKQKVLDRELTLEEARALLADLQMIPPSSHP